MSRVTRQRKTNKQIALEYEHAKRNRVRKQPNLSVYASPVEMTAWQAGLEAKRAKAAARKVAHQEI